MSKIEFKSIDGNGEVEFEFNAAVEVRILNDSGADCGVEMKLYDDNTKANVIALLYKKNVPATAERSFKFFAKAGYCLEVTAPKNCWALCNILQERLIDSGKVTRHVVHYQNGGRVHKEFLLPDVADHAGQISVIVDDVCRAWHKRDWELKADGKAIVFFATREPHASADIAIILDKGVM